MEPAAKRRRANKACQACHDRRVKCTFDQPGAACLHCRISGLECMRCDRPMNLESNIKPSQNSNGMASVFSNSASVSRYRHLDTFPQGLRASLPAFLRPFSRNPHHVEVQFLEQRGAFSIPEPKILSELIDVYFDLVNPFLPLFDYSEILALVRQQGEDEPTFNATPNISLLVLQAIIFGASAFVPLATLKPMGFNSREEARINLYRRAIALHDLELEADDVSVAQARLIFTHWVEIEDQRNPWYWMGSAVSKIQSMDLREILGDTTICRSRLGTLKRLWWSCVVRDTILALGGRFLPRFRPEECEICMLSFDDFPSTCQPSHITASSTTTYAIDKGTIRGRSVAISVEMAKMSLCLNRVLWVQSSVSSILRSPMLVKLGRDQRIYRKLMAAEIDACFRKVKAWFEGLHEDARWPVDQPNQDQSHKGSDLGRVLLRMAYYTAINCLYRPQVLPSDSETAFAVHTEEREYSTYCRKLLWAAQGVARCSEDLVRNHLGEHLPSFSTSFVIPALVVLHARFRHSQNSSSQHKATPDYASCMLLLRTLRARYTCAERANTYLDRLMPGHGENDESDQSPAQTLTETTTQPSPTGVTQASPQMPPRTSFNLDGRLEDNRQASSSGSDLIALQEHYGTNDTPSAASSDYEHLALLNQEFLSFAEHQRDAFTGTTPLDLSWIETDDFEGSLFDMSILPTLPPNDFDGEEENLVNTFGLNNNQEEVLTG